MEYNNIGTEPEGAPDEVAPSLQTRGELIAFAYEVGSAIAVPLIIFVLIGRTLDKHYSTGHLYLICGLVLSLASTGFIIYKKVKKFI